MEQESSIIDEKIIHFYLNEELKKENITDWKIDYYHTKQNNIYIEQNFKTESILKSERKEYLITVYKSFESKIGTSTFILNDSSTIKELKEEIQDAVFISSVSLSEKYILPKVEDESVKDDHIDYSIFYNQKVHDNFDIYDFEAFLNEKFNILKDEIETNNDEKVKLKINYVEFFNSAGFHKLTTSSGINKSSKNNSTYLEFVITATDINKNEEKEHIIYEEISDLLEFNFYDFFKKHLKYAKDTITAQNALDFKGPVILTGFAGPDFFIPTIGDLNPFILFASAKLKFMQISDYQINQKVLNTKKDHLTIYSNPFISKNSASVPYDDLGISAQKICIINDSVFKNHISSKQYADYINVLPSGPLGVIEVSSGSKNEDDMYNDNEDKIEIVSFSSFDPDSTSGDFSSEIRLGYRIKNGIRIPFKGGLFVGNVFKIIEEMYLSKEQINIPGYCGPRTIKFNKGKIVGL